MSTDSLDSATSRPDLKEAIKVLVVDDHAVVRQGLRTFLELQDDPSALPIEVVGEATNGVEAVDLARQLQPDVVLLDLVMPDMDGVQATPRIVESSPHSQVIILTSFGEEDKVFPAIRAGAQGYLLKDIAPDDLVQAVRAVYLGQVQLHPDLESRVFIPENAGIQFDNLFVADRVPELFGGYLPQAVVLLHDILSGRLCLRCRLWVVGGWQKSLSDRFHLLEQ